MSAVVMLPGMINVLCNCTFIRAGRVWFKYFYAQEKLRPGRGRLSGSAPPASPGAAKTSSISSSDSTSGRGAPSVTALAATSTGSKRAGDEVGTESCSDGIATNVSIRITDCKGATRSRRLDRSKISWFAKRQHLVETRNMLFAVWGFAALQFTVPLAVYFAEVDRLDISIEALPEDIFLCEQNTNSTLAFGVLVGTLTNSSCRFAPLLRVVSQFRSVSLFLFDDELSRRQLR